MTPRIFICYRREDGKHPAGRLCDRLVAQFGPHNVFMDVDSIRPGDDFQDVIEKTVSTCSILFAVIGRRWVGDSQTESRLNNPNDWVRLEIEAALKRNIRVVPILVDSADLPQPAKLPDSLVQLTRRQAYELRDTTFRADADRLIEIINDLHKSSVPEVSALGPAVASAINLPLAALRASATALRSLVRRHPAISCFAAVVVIGATLTATPFGSRAFTSLRTAVAATYRKRADAKTASSPSLTTTMAEPPIQPSANTGVAPHNGPGYEPPANRRVVPRDGSSPASVPLPTSAASITRPEKDEAAPKLTLDPVKLEWLLGSAANTQDAAKGSCSKLNFTYPYNADWKRPWRLPEAQELKSCPDEICSHIFESKKAKVVARLREAPILGSEKPYYWVADDFTPRVILGRFGASVTAPVTDYGDDPELFHFDVLRNHLVTGNFPNATTICVRAGNN
jgi:hypothetical protein